MPYREFHYHWEYDLKASPEKLWPFVADTNRFNRDTNVPAVEVDRPTRRLRNARRRVRLSVLGLKAMLRAQRILASPAEGVAPLTLKAGIHTGPCIAVTLNDRLDYFGSTVNMAARLEGLSTGNDVIISRALYDDPEVRALVDSGELEASSFDIELKGFEKERFELWRVARAAKSTAK